MKKLLVILILSGTIFSCNTGKEIAAKKAILTETPIEVEATCFGISSNQMSKEELEKQIVVSVEVQEFQTEEGIEKSVLIAPPAKASANSSSLQGALVRDFQIDGDNALEFPDGSHFLIKSVTEFMEGSCPQEINANIKTESGLLFTLAFILRESGLYTPVVDLENNNYVIENDMYRTTDVVTGKKLWIRNINFRLDKLYLIQRRKDTREVEQTKGYAKPGTNTKKS
jgi:hypothetical protein